MITPQQDGAPPYTAFGVTDILKAHFRNGIISNRCLARLDHLTLLTLATVIILSGALLKLTATEVRVVLITSQTRNMKSTQILVPVLSDGQYKLFLCLYAVTVLGILR
jgi:hypothetical protein